MIGKPGPPGQIMKPKKANKLAGILRSENLGKLRFAIRAREIICLRYSPQRRGLIPGALLVMFAGRLPTL